MGSALLMSRLRSVLVFVPLLVLAPACETRTYDATSFFTPDAAAAAPDGARNAGGGGGNGGASVGGRGDGGSGGGGSPGRDGGTNFCLDRQPEICDGADNDCNGAVDDVSPEMLATVEACGACGSICPQPANAAATCKASQCGFDCKLGYVDLNKNKTDGCECRLVAAEWDAASAKPETFCDDTDNDCDGLVDEGFDKATDVNNCGSCNFRCTLPFQTVSCVAGACVPGACLPGYVDLDPNVAGCETACTKTNGGVEVCDGLDNDCNGLVDDGVAAPVGLLCKAVGVCAGTAPTCHGVTGWSCTYPTTYRESEDKTLPCDGLDNDCNGLVDEAFNVGAPCSVGSGGCTNTGTLICAPGGTTTQCSVGAKPPGAEVCNGIDDDCDGQVDELSATDRTSDERFVFVPSLNVTVFAFEASRPDATNSGAGAESAGRPCASPNRLPWSNITSDEAERACRAVGAGWRLCTKTEWESLCRGSGQTLFPYGGTYAGDKCNGADYPKAAGATTIPAGSDAMCVSSWGAGATASSVADMSGNVKEWVVAGTPNADPALQAYELRGGAYNNVSFPDGTAPGLQCDSVIPAPTVPLRLPSVGFRCCKEGAL